METSASFEARSAPSPYPTLFRRTKGGIVVSTKKSNGKSCPEMLAVLEFQAQFGDERQCGEKLSRQQWAGGLVCPRCGGPSWGSMATRQVHEYARCGYQCSVTAGTVFHKTRVPLTGWFWAVSRLSHNEKASRPCNLERGLGSAIRPPGCCCTSSARRWSTAIRDRS